MKRAAACIRSRAAVGVAALVVAAGLSMLVPARADGMSMLVPAGAGGQGTPTVNRDINSYVLFAAGQVELKGGNTSAGDRGIISGGNVGANGVGLSSGEPSVAICSNGTATMSDGTQMVGAVVRFTPLCDVYDAFFNTNLGSQPQGVARHFQGPFVPPVIDPLPPVPEFACDPNAPVLEAQTNGSRTVSPGTYSRIIFKDNSTVAMEPGLYTACTFSTGRNVVVTTSPGVVMHVQVQWELGNGSNFGGPTCSGIPNVVVRGVDAPGFSIGNNDNSILFPAGGGSANAWGHFYAGSHRVALGQSNNLHGTFWAGQIAGEIVGRIGSDFNGNLEYCRPDIEPPPPDEEQTISGRKFNDLAGDGVNDSSDPGLEGWEIRAYADNDPQNGVLDVTEAAAGPVATDTTGPAGAYTFNLEPGSYVICEVLKPDWAQSYPRGAPAECRADLSLGPQGYAVTLVAGQDETGNAFGNTQPPASVSICHATGDEDAPYSLAEPAILVDGVLEDGHRGHPGDIIPPYLYRDSEGNLQLFVGQHWDAGAGGGQEIWNSDCVVPPPPPDPDPDPLTPSVRCIELLPSGGFLAHFGYANPNGEETVIPIGPDNQFTPGDPNRGQPTAFQPTTVPDAVQAESQDGQPLTWSLTGNQATATIDSERCQGSITIIKQVLSTLPDDPGRFNLEIDGVVVSNGPVGDGGSAGPIAVTTGTHSVGESGAATNLSNFVISIVCRTGLGAGPVVSGSTNAVSIPVTVGDGEAVVCTITNERKPVPPRPPEPEEPLDLVVTKTASPTTVQEGGLITWTMTVTNVSSVDAPNVQGLKINETSFKTELISLTPSQGTCAPSPPSCDLGFIAAGASVTITAVTRATDAGDVVNCVRATSEEPESDLTNNDACALARVVGRPPVVDRCRSLVVSPKLLRAARESVVLATARNLIGEPLAGILVRARGAGVNALVRTNDRGVARFTFTAPHFGIIRFKGASGRITVPVTQLGCRSRVGVLRPKKPPPLTGRPG
jgi:hypothetical protein